MKTVKFPFTVTQAGVTAKIRRVTQTKNGKSYTAFVVEYWLLGKRKREWHSDFEIAKAAASEACLKIANGEQMALELRNGDRLAYLRATEALTPVGVQLDLATQEYATAFQLLDGKISIIEVCRDWARRNAVALPRISVSDAVEKLKEQSRLDHKSELRQKQLRIVLDRFAKGFNVDVHTVMPSMIADYLSILPVCERSKRNHRDVLGFFNRWLILRGYLAKGTDWLEGVQQYSARKLSEIEIYTPQEARRLLEAAGDMTPFIAISAFAGLRHAEITRLEWSEIDLDDGFIEVMAAKSKTGERRLVPIHDNLKKWLLPYQKPQGRVAPYANTTKQLIKVAKDAGVRLKRNGLRHSAISYRMAQCADVARVADEAGNSPAMIRQHYLRRVKPAAANEWFSIAPREEQGNIVPFLNPQEPMIAVNG